MKKKLIEKTVPKTCDKRHMRNEWWVEPQVVDNILICNIYKLGRLWRRHCTNLDTGEYATWLSANGSWMNWNIETTLDVDYYKKYTHEAYSRMNMSEKSEKLIRDKIKDRYRSEILSVMAEFEAEYKREQRYRAEDRRIDRVNAVMAQVPACPDLRSWIDEKVLKSEDYAMKEKATGLWGCTDCGKTFDKKQIKRVDGQQNLRNNDMVICPHCGTHIRYLTRKKKIDIASMVAIMQPISDEMSVIRYFDTVIVCEAGHKKAIGTDEAIRMIIKKHATIFGNRSSIDIYYNQYHRGWAWIGKNEQVRSGCFDNKSNPGNRRIKSCYLYEQGIEETLQNSCYAAWINACKAGAAAGIRMEYNNLLACREPALPDIVELLVKGRFYRLLAEDSYYISLWDYAYHGKLMMWARNLEEVFDIGDMQKIYRIRDRNGGIKMLEWMRWSDENDIKLSDKALDWLINSDIAINQMKLIMEHMSPEQAMNYIERQRKESYPGMKASYVLNQYDDYIVMAERLGKDIVDSLTYKPRELKRRHDEAVKEMELRRAEIIADEYSARFPEAEKVLKQIKKKFEYTSGGYMIRVPDRIADIVKEGNSLHHCAGATDRYFDRIAQHETYICFLRKAAEPDTAFYTIEVEPGGTIRQHRGMYDEEPELETVKPFLREWQKEIRKRMSKKDHERAERSKIAREANIEELKQKNNTRVLQGLMEDFMEAAG